MKIPPTAQTRLPEAIQRLVDLSVAWEKPEQAAEWQKQLDQVQATMKDSEAKPSKEPTKCGRTVGGSVGFSRLMTGKQCESGTPEL